MAFKTDINLSKPLPYVHNPVQKTVDKVNEAVPLDKPQKNNVDLTPKGLSPSVNKAYNNILAGTKSSGTNPTGSVSPLGGYSPKSSVVSLDKPVQTQKNDALDTAVSNIMNAHDAKKATQNAGNFNQNTENVSSGNLLPNGTLAKPTAGAVRVVDYLNSKPDAHVTWDNELGQVIINGVPVPKDKVFLSNDGRSYVSRGIVDSIYDSTVKNDDSSFENNVQRFDDIYDRISPLTDKVGNPQSYSYDVRKDPLFEVYSDYYDKMGDDAFNDTLASVAARNGGYINSHAIAAAAQAKAQWNSQKANIIPTLEEINYNRYIKERETDQNSLTALGNIFNTIEQGRSGFVSDSNAQETDRELGYYGIDLQRNAQAEDKAYKYAVLALDELVANHQITKDDRDYILNKLLAEHQIDKDNKYYDLDKQTTEHQIDKDNKYYELDKQTTDYQTGKPYYKPTPPKTTPSTTPSTSAIDTSEYFK